MFGMKEFEFEFEWGLYALSHEGEGGLTAHEFASCVTDFLVYSQMHCPADCVTYIKDARTEPEPYNVQYLDHTFFKDFKDPEVHSSRFKSWRSNRHRHQGTEIFPGWKGALQTQTS